MTDLERYSSWDRWTAVWHRLKIRAAPQQVFEELIQSYSSPERYYHNVAHLEDCLAIFAQSKSLARHPEQVELAIWFHDAIYDTRRNDNEQQSAAWAARVIDQAGLGTAVARRISDLILATRHVEDAPDADAGLIVDVDLSILGREPDIYWRYEENIRKEYAWVPEEVFRQKRREILQGFLSRPSIYHHAPYREMYEQNARHNLRQAIARLADGAEHPEKS